MRTANANALHKPEVRTLRFAIVDGTILGPPSCSVKIFYGQGRVNSLGNPALTLRATADKRIPPSRAGTKAARAIGAEALSLETGNRSDLLGKESGRERIDANGVCNLAIRTANQKDWLVIVARK
jgi:hypothetical protein